MKSLEKPKERKNLNKGTLVGGRGNACLRKSCVTEMVKKPVRKKPT